MLGIVLLLLEVLVPFEGGREVCGEVGLDNLGDGLHIGVFYEQGELGRHGRGAEVVDSGGRECAR